MHLCEHLACLQRQVCHLQHQLARARAPPAAPTNRELEAAQAETARLETKCDALLDQKKQHLERIQQLQRQLETSLAVSNPDQRLRGLIADIEHQRDGYKRQVEQHIREIQGRGWAQGPDTQAEQGAGAGRGTGQRRTLTSRSRPEQQQAEAAREVCFLKAG